MTLPPALRDQSSLEGVPRVYRHPQCGGMTGMPEEIIRSYLKNPFMYNGKTFCTGCQAYVDCGELFWVETGQRLSEYNAELQRNARQDRR